jgi:hypothetical protein
MQETNPTADRRPNTFVIGAPKCGTSAMAAYLNAHPNVYLSEPKEPFFWSSDYPELRSIAGVTDLKQYLNLFQSATEQHQVICEGSTNYLASDVAVEKIVSFDPDAKFLVMLRNPVDVVHAFHSELLFSYIEDEPCFEKAWALQDQRLGGQSLPPDCVAPKFLQYRSVAAYASQLKRFFSLVPAENRQVIIFDDFAKDNAASYAQTLAFLDLSPFQMESFNKINASHGHRFPVLSKMVMDPPKPIKPVMNSLRFAARKFKGGWIDQAKHMLRKPVKRKPLCPAFAQRLREYFADDVAQTSQLLGRDLTHWTRTPTSQTLAVPSPPMQTPRSLADVS